MVAEERDSMNEEFATPHLPERYHQAVKAKRQRRLKQKILIGCAVLVGIVVLYLIITAIIGGFFSDIPGATQGPPQVPVPTPMAMAAVTVTTMPATEPARTAAPVPFTDSTGRSAGPVFDLSAAQEIAERHIADDNGGQIPVNLTSAIYTPIQSPAGPVAGQYRLRYNRLYNDYPTEVDGFEVVVDSQTGKVTGYKRQWTTQEYAFSSSAYVGTTRSEATFTTLQKAKEYYPDEVGSVRIVSADVLWKNGIPEGTIPRPGSIPLAWRVIFEDDAIRANPSLPKGVAWVEAQTGELLSFEYKH